MLLERSLWVKESLINTVNEIQRFCTLMGDDGGEDYSLWDSLPYVAVVGAVGSGMSSLLEMIVGQDFLPKPNESGCIPLVLHLHYNNYHLIGNHKLIAEFAHLPSHHFFDFSKVREEILLETKDRMQGNPNQISYSPIHLAIYSPNVVNLTLICLPGLTRVALDGQPKSLPKDIENMVRSYIEKPNCTILAISPADQDIATSDSLRLAKEVDPCGERTFGVLTKLDLMDKGTDALDVLQGSRIRLQHPWVGIANGTKRHSDMMCARQTERDYFAASPSYRHLASQMGSEYLAKLISQHLDAVIRAEIPGLKSLLDKGIDGLEQCFIRLNGRISVYKAARDEIAAVAGAVLDDIKCKTAKLTTQGKSKENYGVISKTDGIDMENQCTMAIWHFVKKAHKMVNDRILVYKAAARIEKMVRSYIEKPNCSILAISQADQDIATSDSLRLAKEVDPWGERTFGVLTKLDLMDKGTDALNVVLQGSHYRLQHPWVGIANGKKRHSDMMCARQTERDYFATSPSYRHLAKLISQHLDAVIRAEIPGLKSLLDKGIDELEQRLVNLNGRISVYESVRDEIAAVAGAELDDIKCKTAELTTQGKAKEHDGVISKTEE